VIIFGIGIGVGVQMFVGLIIDSLQANLVARTVGRSAHVTITATKDGEYIDAPREIIQRIDTSIPVARIQQTITANVVLIGTDTVTGALFRGMDLTASDIYGVRESIVAGSLPSASDEVLVGIGLLQETEKSLGDEIIISDGSGRRGIYRITGVFDVGVGAVNDGWIAADTGIVQRYLGLRNSVDSIVIQVSDVFAADRIANDIRDIVAVRGLAVSDWKQENAELLNALASQSSSTFMIQFFVLVSVIIAISSVLSVTVMQKQRQIGILKAMGLSDTTARNIILLVSFIMGSIGSALGLGIGFVLFFGFIAGTGMFDPIIRWPYILGTLIITTLAAASAGILPAQRSARLNPIDIIQNE